MAVGGEALGTGSPAWRLRGGSISFCAEGGSEGRGAKRRLREEEGGKGRNVYLAFQRTDEQAF